MDPKTKGYIISDARRRFRFSQLKRDIYKRDAAGGTGKCYLCGVKLLAKDLDLEHIEPVVDPTVGFVDWNTYYSRLFCSPSNLALSCKPCHGHKTAAENSLRAKHKTGQFSAESKARAKATRSRRAKKR